MTEQKPVTEEFDVLAADDQGQAGRKPDDPDQVPVNPKDDHGGGGDSDSEATGSGPSGGADPAPPSGGSEGVGSGPSGGAE